MDKRLLQTFFITILFLMGYSLFISPRQANHPQTTTLPSGEIPKVASALPKEALVIEDTIDLPSTTIDDFIITYSPTGGYVKKVYSKPHQEELLYKNIGFILQEKNEKFKVSLQRNQIIFTSASGKQKEFIFQKNLLKIKLSSPLPPTMTLFSNSLSNNSLEQGYQEIFFAQAVDLQRKNLRDLKNQSTMEFNKLKFAGARDQYFCASLLADSYHLKVSKDKKEAYFTLVSPPAEISLYLGSQAEKSLKAVGLESIINYGFFHGIGWGLAWILSVFYALVKNWGVSIILFAIFVYFLLFPFTMKSTKAMKRMAELQPNIEELRKKYKDNPQKLNKEILELYRKYKINPLGSCLPLLFQFPIFIALYQVLLRFVELKGVSFLWIKDLTLPDRAIKLPFPPPIDYLNILPIIIAVLGLLQQKLTTASSLSKDQKSMGLIFSVLMGVIFYNFPASLNLYWVIQNLLTFIYQLRISKSVHPSHIEA
jgi:YidC/Oxa1 family membrane protein insertase